MRVFIVFSARKVFGLYHSLDDALDAKDRAQGDSRELILIETHAVEGEIVKKRLKRRRR